MDKKKTFNEFDFIEVYIWKNKILQKNFFLFACVFFKNIKEVNVKRELQDWLRLSKQEVIFHILNFYSPKMYDFRVF